MLAEVRDQVQGVQVSAPFGNFNAAAEVLGLRGDGEARSVECRSFEEQLAELEKIVEQLEHGDLPLERA